MLKFSFAFILGWLIPGAGHFYLGKRAKAIFLFIILSVTCIVGIAISGFRTIKWSDNWFFYLGNFFCGITLLLATILERAYPLDNYSNMVTWFDPGVFYICVVGILNLVILLDIIDMVFIKEGCQIKEVKVKDELSDSLRTNLPGDTTGAGSA